jgi:hypothetical protein
MIGGNLADDQWDDLDNQRSCLFLLPEAVEMIGGNLACGHWDDDIPAGGSPLGRGVDASRGQGHRSLPLLLLRLHQKFYWIEFHKNLTMAIEYRALL